MEDSMHVVHPRAAGLDVHKAAITATVRVIRPDGKAESETREFSTLPSGISALTDWLGKRKVKAALMEATGVYWEAPFDALARAGIKPTLVHAQQVKQIKGRKTDVEDSLWLARLCQFGLASPSLVLEKEDRDLRVLSRYRRALVRERTVTRNRVQKLLDRAGIRVGGILTDIFGLNGRYILEGLCAGDDRRRILFRLTRHVRAKLEDLGDALTLRLSENDRFILTRLLSTHDHFAQQESLVAKRITEALERQSERIRLLTTIPGIQHDSACAILVEIGPDLEVFPSANQLAAWGGLCPGNNQSGGKRRSSRIRKGNRSLRSTLTECAQGAARTQGCQFHSYHKSIMIRRGYKRAVVATAHKMLRVIYAVLKSGQPYRDPVVTREQLMVRKNAPRWIRMLQTYGHLVLDPPEHLEPPLATPEALS